MQCKTFKKQTDCQPIPVIIIPQHLHQNFGHAFILFLATEFSDIPGGRSFRVLSKGGL